jgi:peptidoglycan-N-acetylglucosamine deacetylase
MPWLIGLAATLTILTGALWTAPRWLVPLIAARSPRCLYAVTTREKVVALTIDDGPDPAHTPALLRVLQDHDARATFFLISGNVPGAEAIVRDVVARGHELGNHLTREEPSIRLASPAFVQSTREAGSMLSRFGPVRWLRPGSGWYNDTMLDAIENEGYRCALGSVYPYDGRGMPARIAAAYILANTRPGAVIILHEGKGRGPRTVAVLESVLPALRARGYRVVTLSELFRPSS